MKTTKSLTPFCLSLLSLALPLSAQRGGGGGGTPPPVPDLACVSVSGTPYIKVMSRDGSNLRNVRQESYVIFPALSPDGTQVAFAKVRAGVAAVWVVNVDGTGLRAVTHLVHASFYAGDHAIWMRPVWSPVAAPGGQRKLLFADELTVSGGTFQLFTVNLDGTGRTQLTNTPGVGMTDTFDWAPDATRVAYVTHADDLVVANLADVEGSLTIATQTTVASLWQCSGLAWSNSGNVLAVTRAPGGAGDQHIWLLDLANPQASLVQLTTMSSYQIVPTFSSDDRRVFFRASGATWVVNTDGTSVPTKVTSKATFAHYRRG